LELGNAAFGTGRESQRTQRKLSAQGEDKKKLSEKVMKKWPTQVQMQSNSK